MLVFISNSEATQKREDCIKHKHGYPYESTIDKYYWHYCINFLGSGEAGEEFNYSNAFVGLAIEYGLSPDHDKIEKGLLVQEIYQDDPTVFELASSYHRLMFEQKLNQLMAKNPSKNARAAMEISKLYTNALNTEGCHSVRTFIDCLYSQGFLTNDSEEDYFNQQAEKWRLVAAEIGLPQAMYETGVSYLAQGHFYGDKPALQIAIYYGQSCINAGGYSVSEDVLAESCEELVKISSYLLESFQRNEALEAVGKSIALFVGGLALLKESGIFEKSPNSNSGYSASRWTSSQNRCQSRKSQCLAQCQTVPIKAPGKSMATTALGGSPRTACTWECHKISCY